MEARGLAGGETTRLRPEDRLLRRRDFQRSYREGRREHGVAAVLHAAPTTGYQGRCRLGITATRKVGGAVTRNRLKRQVREVFRRSKSRPGLIGLDLVIHLKPESARLVFHDMKEDLDSLFARMAARWATAPGRER
ncbi:MAG TPA: ribonuclease P protein component [Thermoanaerobaculia bacterium]|nr:ribonuclease P protein component [Thermoanaerobaculia bacterium]